MKESPTTASQISFSMYSADALSGILTNTEEYYQLSLSDSKTHARSYKHSIQNCRCRGSEQKGHFKLPCEIFSSLSQNKQFLCPNQEKFLKDDRTLVKTRQVYNGKQILP